MENQRDLFYYMIQNDSERYQEISNLVEKHNNFDKDSMTDEQYFFLMKMYINLLYRIAFMEYRKYTDEEIVKLLNLNCNVNLIGMDSLFRLKMEYRDVLDRYIEIFEDIYKNVTVSSVEVENIDFNKKIEKVLKENKL